MSAYRHALILSGQISDGKGLAPFGYSQDHMAALESRFWHQAKGLP